MTSEEVADFLTQMHVDYFRAQPMGQVAQTVLMESEDGKTHTMPFSFSDTLERALVVAMLRGLMADQKVVRYAIWCEAWIRKLPRTGLDDYELGDLAVDPASEEIVWTVVVDTAQKIGRAQKIIRGRNGGVRELQLKPLDDASELLGEFAHLLPERTIQ
jgi:hypothetical protein